ncbi:Ran-binding protein 1-like protein b [Dichanthelium oligosanthes]|uniref:Ran-specific GTPase-activating protein n=1 Tax=Dichanthelium oligosanthes TaxID=888268 RepID=A0A1E5UKC8_9POAL|nr:Ran-binding protein 1-like protein b [Dichanthelium oligosanthes]
MADKEPVTERPGAAEEEEDASGAAAAGEEEDTGAQVAPIVRLEEVAVTTGEEDEDVLLDMKAKLYRFDKDGNQWKERGTGTVKLLKHKENGKVRLVMRQAKTLKICANHLVVSSMKMQEHAGSDKSCVWHAADFADDCKKFKDLVEEIAESLAKNEVNESEDGSSTAGLMEKLTVSESKSDESIKPESTESGKETETKAEATPSE